jgi:glucose/arabinose dehydrogenase/mono/diheme cytochrome c family protein
MNNKVHIGVLLSISALTLLSFKSQTSKQDPWIAPSSADTIKSQVSVAPYVLKEGEKLYQTYCASCHGKTGLGDGSPGKFPIEPANFHSKSVQSQTDGALYWKLTKGRGVMPAYGAVFTEEIKWQIISYLRHIPKQNSTPAAKPILTLNKYRIAAKLSDLHAPIPSKITNVVNSDLQLFMVDTLAKGLTRPWSMALLPDGSILIPERGGNIKFLKNGRLQASPLKGDIPKGLRDVKIHPNFSNNRLVYLSYYIDPVKPARTGHTVLMRAKLVDDRLVDNTILYKSAAIAGDGEWFGSKLEFDRKGHILFTIGIRGPRKNAQDLTVIDGKTLRIKEDGSIPNDNPFVKTPGALPEIYSYGHRMHQGLAYDFKNGQILSTEFGELGGDELNVIKAGANYGWPIVSHSLEYNGSVISESPYKEGIEAPLHHYANAPSDLYINYSNKYPQWVSNVFIGGLAAKHLYRLEIKDNKVVKEETMLNNIGRVRDVKIGYDGLLYLLTEDNGLLIRLIPVKQIGK